MELRLLRTFVAVANLRSFSAAARELNTVQPAVSRQIADLEGELGVRLLWRNTREVRVTAAGESLLRDARDILAREEEAAEQVRRAARGQIGRLRIGYLGPACLAFVADLVGTFTRAHPEVHITLREMTVQQQLDAFDADDIDVGLSRPMTHERAQGFVAEEIYRDSLMAVVPEEHPLAAVKVMLLRKLEGERFVLFSREEAVGLFDRIIGLCQKEAFEPVITSQPTTMQTVLTAVAAGLGVSVMPGCCRQLHVAGCRFVPIRGQKATIGTELHYRNDPVLPTARAFASLVSQAGSGIQEQMSADR